MPLLRQLILVLFLCPLISSPAFAQSDGQKDGQLTANEQEIIDWIGKLQLPIVNEKQLVKVATGSLLQTRIRSLLWLGQISCSGRQGIRGCVAGDGEVILPLDEYRQCAL